MPTFDDELKIASQFPQPSIEAWEEAAQKSLKGQALSSLVVTTHEGLVVKPVYTAEDVPLETADRDRTRKRPAEVACLIDLRDPKGTIGRIVEARDCGADALWIWLDRRSSSWGKLSADSFALFLEAADGAPIYLDGRGAATALTALLIASTQRVDGGLESLVGSFDIDPLGTFSADGSLPTSLVRSFDLMAESLRWCEDLAPRMRTIAVSTLPHAKAGATAIQELAFLLATTVAYLREMEKRGVSPEVVGRRLRFVTSVGRDLFMETAKLRAMRWLWDRIAGVCSISSRESAVPIHGIASPRCLTARDPWVNILRGTTAAYTAVIGGADVVTVLPFDSVAGRSDELARRLAINTSIILREESHIDRVRDPAAGSYLVERLTSDLCTAAWEEFQRIEASGGVVNLLTSGALARELADTLTAKRLSVVTLREPVTGVSSFPNLEEDSIDRHRPTRGPKQPPDEVSTDVHRTVEAKTGTFTAALDVAHGGITFSELVDVLNRSDEKDSLSPVLTEREAQPFEALRDASDLHLRATGLRPRVFLASVGTSTENRASTAFVSNLLAAGGLKTVLAEDLGSAQALATAFAASGSRSAVICAAPDRDSDIISQLAQEMKSLRARRVLVAGNPGRFERAWREAGVDGFIRNGVNAVALLTDLLKAEGVDHG